MTAVTVLMPVRNAATTIEAAARSVLTQSLADLELLVVDDGSSDDSVHRLLGIGDPRVRVLQCPPLGIVAALNHGLDAARTELIARMDADDRMLPGRLVRQVAALAADPTLDGVGTWVQLEPPGSALAPYVAWLNRMQSPQDIAREAFVEAPLCHPSVMFRRAAVGRYRERPWPEDYDLWLRILEAGGRLGVVPEVLHVWSDHPMRLTRRDPRCAPAAFFRVKAHFLARRYPVVRIWGAGRDGRRLARALEAEGTRIEAFVDVDPRKIGGVRRGSVPVIGPNDLTPGAPILTAVGVPAAREAIRAALIAQGFEEGRDFVCAA